MTTANVTVVGDFRPIGPTGEGGKLGHEASMGAYRPSFANF